MAAILIVVLSGIFLVFLLNFVLLELDIENHLYVNAVISSQSVSGPSRFYGCWPNQALAEFQKLESGTFIFCAHHSKLAVTQLLCLSGSKWR